MSLRGYLNAPPVVREAFDRAQAAAIDRSLAKQREIDDWYEAEVADDPTVQAVARRRRNDRLIVEAIDGVAADPPTTVPGICWDEHWQRRADAARRLGERASVSYSRDADPLFDLDLRDVWEQLTGEPGGAIVRCPHPDHEDRWPSCAVRARLFYCNSCPARGSIIDLGAYLYGIEPRGSGFFQIRDRLLATLGMEAA